MTASNVLKLIKDKEVEYVDLRFTDPRGKLQHLTMDATVVDEGMLNDGVFFDGSSIAGWKAINESDMILMPDDETAVVDPFTEETTVNLRCDILEPSTLQGYERDPRSLGKRAEAYLSSTSIGDTAYFGNEPEFFVFDSVKWDTGHGMGKAFFEIKYATIISIDSKITDKKTISKIVLCDLQKEVYPKINNIFLDLIKKAGYPHISIEKQVDFEKMYNDKFN